MKNKIVVLLVVMSVVAASMCPKTEAIAVEDVSVSGNALWIGNYLTQKNLSSAEDTRRQFDLAVNVDFAFALKENIEGILQLQASPGEGSFDYPGPEPVLTDANLTGTFAEGALEVTVGSFDTPFGWQTNFLTNNGDATGNPMILNSLFYSVLAGTNVGTLNTVGIVGTARSRFVAVTAAVTNGSDESAANPDGDFGVVVRPTVMPLGTEDLTITGSAMYTDETAPSAPAGFGARFLGLMGDARYHFTATSHVAGYGGVLDFDDIDDATDDGVVVWMGEAVYGKDAWHVGVRLSGWVPEDDNGDGSGVSAVMPSAGLAIDVSGGSIMTDQKVTRLQIGGGIVVFDAIVARAEYVGDFYDVEVASDKTNVNGVLIGLQGEF